MTSPPSVTHQRPASLRFWETRYEIFFSAMIFDIFILDSKLQSLYRGRLQRSVNMVFDVPRGFAQTCM